MLGPASLTALAAVLVLLALNAPNRLEDMEPSAFVRLPGEAIVFLAIVLALPPRFSRARMILSVVAGAVLGLTAVLTVLDIGFLATLNRPFDALSDWRYTGSLMETVRGSADGALGIVLLVLAVGPLALLVHARWAPLQRLDDAGSDAAERLVGASPALLATARLVTHLGDPLLVTVASGLLAAGLWATGHRRTALFVLVARAGALVLSTGLKQVVGRARPVFDTPVSSEFGLSFPSGHAANTTGAVVVVLLLVWPLLRTTAARVVALAAGLAVVLVTGADRVLLGVHYPSDVVGGFLVGGGIALTSWAAFGPLNRATRDTATPDEEPV